MSIMMDSCNIMRGSKAGLETRIRGTIAPHLLDIDGDAAHHIHHSAKQFSMPFNKHVENLCDDVILTLNSRKIYENIFQIFV